ncbi:methyltransferase domain-containing protein [Mariprofundus erugo]|uniref:RsmB/NOP family class I SAM-dependent RNA methyltransferase n=1 Tax=Mariprofundus erugo TaxID=2528639 RepID=UPI0010FCEA5A|nr:transcription antitermination factor NusB [Mariprofundus erugo]TLS74874.1 methyltransferase domain-containing protein [Mariprofundus erugo]
MLVRKAAIQCLEELFVSHDKADSAMDRFGASLDDRERRFLHELVYGVLRYYYSLEADYSRFCRTRPDEVARMALLVGSYQLRHMRVPAHAAVSETVAAVLQLRPKAGGFVNAVLRRVGENEAPKKLKPNQRAELPKWIYSHWRDDFGAEQTEALCQALKEVPKLSLALFVDRKSWIEQVMAAGIEVSAGQLSPYAVLLPAGTDITALPGYAAGDFTVMDQAAQAAVMALEPLNPSGLIVDVCAAPGGKTALLAHRFPAATIIAVELNGRRIPRLMENLNRLGCRNVQVVQANGGVLPLADASVDAVLLDAPCSASGILRRHPDAKFLHDEQSVAALSRQQAELLTEALRVAGSDAAVVYAVCSIHRQENEQVLAMTGLDWHSTRLFPAEAHDGFFHARRCVDQQRVS